MKELAEKYGENDVWVFGLTNGHVGIFWTPKEYEGGYESCVGLHGGNAGVDLLSAHEEIQKKEIPNPSALPCPLS